MEEYMYALGHRKLPAAYGLQAVLYTGWLQTWPLLATGSAWPFQQNSIQRALLQALCLVF